MCAFSNAALEYTHKYSLSHFTLKQQVKNSHLRMNRNAYPASFYQLKVVKKFFTFKLPFLSFNYLENFINLTVTVRSLRGVFLPTGCCAAYFHLYLPKLVLMSWALRHLALL